MWPKFTVQMFARVIYMDYIQTGERSDAVSPYVNTAALISHHIGIASEIKLPRGGKEQEAIFNERYIKRQAH